MRELKEHRLVEASVEWRSPKNIAGGHHHGEFEVNEDLFPIQNICSLARLQSAGSLGEEGELALKARPRNGLFVSFE